MAGHRLLLGAAAGALALAAGAVLAADGEGAAKVPQFSGLWARTGEPMFEPVVGQAKPVLRFEVDSKDAEEIMAGDWTNPILQPWVRAIVKKNAESEVALKHVYQADDSCWPVAVPAILNMREAVQWLQTEDRITLLYQRDHQIRRIWLNKEHTPNLEPSWYGESVGHFEGDTLVVDTTGIKAAPMSFVDPFGTPHTNGLHVVERYRQITDARGKAIDVTIKVEDPGTFTMPWSGKLTYRPNRAAALEEVICEENNHTFGGETFGPLPEEKHSPF